MLSEVVRGAVQLRLRVIAISKTDLVFPDSDSDLETHVTFELVTFVEQ